MDNFFYKNGILHIDQVSALDIEKQCKTPMYIYSRLSLINNFKNFENALNAKLGKDYPKLIAFSVKSNSNIAVINILQKLNAGADVVSSGELKRAKKAGIKGEKIVFSGVGKTDEDLSLAPANSSIVTTAGEANNTDNNKLAYITPSMGGFQAGYSIADSGTAVQSTDATAMGVSYTMPIAGGSLMVRYNKHSKDGAAAAETESSNYGAKLTMGAASVIVAHGDSTIGGGASQTDDREANGISIRYNLGGGMSVGASTMEATDDKDKTTAGVAEKYTANAAEVSYAVAPGLTAKVTYMDYDYKRGAETLSVDDSGSITQVTISAAF